ncbi:hypothetical protein, partial [Klebsiella pneumoniae]
LSLALISRRLVSSSSFRSTFFPGADRALLLTALSNRPPKKQLINFNKVYIDKNKSKQIKVGF